MSAEDDALETTPGWRVGLLLLVFVVLIALMELFGTWLERVLKRRKGLLLALNALRLELMYVGIVALLLSAFGPQLAKICVAGPNEEPDGPCPPGQESFWSVELQEEIHILLFFVSATHVLYCGVTIYVTEVKLRSWRDWEIRARDRTHIMDMDAPWLLSLLGTNWFYSRAAQLVGQFALGVTEATYHNVRLTFIEQMGLEHSFDFHALVVQSMEEEIAETLRSEWNVWLIGGFMLSLPVPSYVTIWMNVIAHIIAFTIGAHLVGVVVILSVQAMIKYRGDVVFGGMDPHSTAGDEVLHDTRHLKQVSCDNLGVAAAAAKHPPQSLVNGKQGPQLGTLAGGLSSCSVPLGVLELTLASRHARQAANGAAEPAEVLAAPIELPIEHPLDGCSTASRSASSCADTTSPGCVEDDHKALLSPGLAGSGHHMAESAHTHGDHVDISVASRAGGASSSDVPSSHPPRGSPLPQHGRILHGGTGVQDDAAQHHHNSTGHDGTSTTTSLTAVWAAPGVPAAGAGRHSPRRPVSEGALVADPTVIGGMSTAPGQSLPPLSTLHSLASASATSSNLHANEHVVSSNGSHATVGGSNGSSSAPPASHNVPVRSPATFDGASRLQNDNANDASNSVGRSGAQNMMTSCQMDARGDDLPMDAAQTSEAVVSLHQPGSGEETACTQAGGVRTSRHRDSGGGLDTHTEAAAAATAAADGEGLTAAVDGADGPCAGRCCMPLQTCLRPSLRHGHSAEESESLLKELSASGLQDVAVSDLFWFGRPHLLMLMFKYIYFENSFNIAVTCYALIKGLDHAWIFEHQALALTLCSLVASLLLVLHSALYMLPIYSLMLPVGSHCPKRVLRRAVKAGLFPDKKQAVTRTLTAVVHRRTMKRGTSARRTSHT